MDKFYICDVCGNIVQKVHDSKVPVMCCGKPMRELVPNTTEAANEKHLPVVKVEGNVVRVQVGSVEHPMTEGHWITWIMLETNQGMNRKPLTPSDRPEAVFVLAENETPLAAYEYCNLHGLWKTVIE